MFLGRYEHTIDEKGRMTIPARFRELLEGEAFISLGFDQNLIVWPAESFQAIMDRLGSMSVTDPSTLGAMRAVRRHLFVPEGSRDNAYEDRPLPIGSGQTISQPYVVAFMAEQLRLTGKEKVLEIGTGSGYSTAILAAVATKVFSIEIRPELAQQAKERLEKLGVKNVELKAADGYRGWPEEAPFDAILVTAAPEKIPPPLLEQLAPEGRMVIPVGAFYQELKVIKRQGGGYSERSVLPVRFVPFVGEAEGAPPAARDPGTSR